MPTPPNLTAVNAARSALAGARATLVSAIYAAEKAAADLADASRRLSGSALDPFVTAELNARNAATNARAAVRTARTNVATEIANLLAGLTTLDADIGRLAANVPLTLFPVRVETRFGVNAQAAPVLRVRVYPDDIFTNLHETALTPDERDAGIAYWTDVLIDETRTEREAWGVITSQMPAERAAYVVLQMRPSGEGELTFPSPTLKPSSFTRPGEGVLPDRWVVRLIQGATATDYVGKPIPEPLTLTPDPQTKTPGELTQIPGSNPPLMIDDELAWTVDFTRAENVGMALTIPLTAAQAAVGTGGFDRLLVFGVKSSMDRVLGQTLMENLFIAHHYTRGVSLVPQGTATNNTEDAPSPLPIDDPNGETTFPLERGLSPNTNDKDLDGSRLADLIGIRRFIIAQAAGYARNEQILAKNMATLLWPTTLGYVVEQLMSPLFSPAHHDLLRNYILDNVRARGPAPAFRIGEVPYGVLPAVSLEAWKKLGTSPAEGFEAAAVTTFRALRHTWRTAAETLVPVVSATSTDPVKDLLGALALQPSSRELRVRQTQGQLTLLNLANLLGQDFRSAAAEAKAIVADLLGRVSQPTWAGSLLASLVVANKPKLVSIPLVAPAQNLDEVQTLPAALFSAINNGEELVPRTPVANLLDDTLAVPDTVRNTSFYKLVRQSVLWAIVRRSIQAVNDAGNPFAIFFIELQIVNAVAADQTLPFGPLLRTTTLTPPAALGDSTLVRNDPQVQGVFDALQSFRSVPTAEIDRLFSETLDVASHRLDAWLTAYATRRVAEQRAATPGSYFGAYAFVENVRPVARTTSTLPGYGTVETQPGNGGYVQTPSLTHAAAAAILRNGHLSYRDEGANKYAFDLSSARTRAAREVFEELRAGQPLGAILGYRFERGVQANASINQYRFALRNYYPLVPNKAGGATTVPPATVPAVAARAVVDGLALWRAYQANTIPFATAPDLPRPNTAPQIALVAEILKLGDALDGVSDLNVAEAALQLVRGDVTNAAGNLDALARGARPPDPKLAVSQRGGIPTNHRAALVFTGPITPGPLASWGAATPRSIAEPLLDAWAGRILGDPTKAKAHVILDPVGSAQPSSLDVTIADLGLRPLDLVAIARAPASPNAGSILDRRIAAEARRRLGGDTTHTVGAISYVPATGLGSIPQVMEVARALGALLGGARPLASADLVSGADAVTAREVTNADNLAALVDLGNRADGAMNVLDALADDLVPGADLVERLTVAARYVPDAFPAPGASPEALVQAAAAVAGELRRRFAAAQTAISPLATTAHELADQRVAQLRAVFGDDFLALPQAKPPNPTELTQAMGATATLFPGAGDRDQPLQTLQQAGQIYEGLGRFRTLSLYSQVIAGAISAGPPGPVPPPPLRLDVAQVPFAPDEPWVGLKFAAGHEPSPGRQSLLLLSPGNAPPATTGMWQGIVLQDWVEVVPNATEETGLAFHYDNPGAEAAQTILVVPPSSRSDAWTASDVWATLNETLDLAKIRAVDLELVGGMGQFLPAIFAPQNLQGATPSTSWFGQIFNAS